MDSIAKAGLENIRDKIEECSKETGLSIDCIINFYFVMNPPDFDKAFKILNSLLIGD